MPEKIVIECTCPDEIMSRHGCSYITRNQEGKRICGNKCAQNLIIENTKLRHEIYRLREEIVQLKEKIKEMVGEL